MLKKKTCFFLLVMVCALVLALPNTVSAEMAASVIWQGHMLKLEQITRDSNEISKISKNPFPAQGYLALVQLSITDGTVITEAEMEQYGHEFMLEDSENNLFRPSSYGLFSDGSDIGIVFYIRDDGTDDSSLRCYVQPPESVPDTILNAELRWQGRPLAVTTGTLDKAALSQFEWPENGYLIRIEFETTDDSMLWESEIEADGHEIVLTDGEAHQYVYRDRRVVFTKSPHEASSFSLIYAVTGDPPPAADRLALDVRPTLALWIDSAARFAETQSLDRFVPHTPATHTVALALENDTKYRYDSDSAKMNPEAAFLGLESTIEDMVADLSVVFGDSVTITSDPNLASVVIGIDIQYPLAGHYGISGEVKAYDCVLTLTAYEAISHNAISTLKTGNYYGATISVSQGVTEIRQKIPRVADSASSEKRAFISELEDFWNTNP